MDIYEFVLTAAMNPSGSVVIRVWSPMISISSPITRFIIAIATPEPIAARMAMISRAQSRG
jgi:hypothetical protein